MRISKATVWNLIGLGTPIFLALPCVPILIGNLGKERFGLLGLLWGLLGTAALFDLGLGRAMTVLISRRLSRHDVLDVRAGVTSGLIVLALVGFGFAALIAAWSGPIISFVKGSTVPPGQLQAALLVAAPAVFLVVVNSGVSCALEAFQ